MRTRAWPKWAPVGGVRRSICILLFVRRRMSTSKRARLFRSAWRFPFECDVSAARFSTSIVGTKADAHAQRIFLFLGEGLGRTPASMSQIIALQSVHKGVVNRNLHLTVSQVHLLALDREADPPNPLSHRDDWAQCGPVWASVGRCSASARTVSSATSAGPAERGRVRQELPPGHRKAATRAACSAITSALSSSGVPAGSPLTLMSGFDQTGRRGQPPQLSL